GRVISALAAQPPREAEAHVDTAPLRLRSFELLGSLELSLVCARPARLGYAFEHADDSDPAGGGRRRTTVRRTGARHDRYSGADGRRLAAARPAAGRRPRKAPSGDSGAVRARPPCTAEAHESGEPPRPSRGDRTRRRRSERHWNPRLAPPPPRHYA